jgi:hypothetical protein
MTVQKSPGCVKMHGYIQHHQELDQSPLSCKSLAAQVCIASHGTVHILQESHAAEQAVEQARVALQQVRAQHTAATAQLDEQQHTADNAANDALVADAQAVHLCQDGSLDAAAAQSMLVAQLYDAAREAHQNVAVLGIRVEALAAKATQLEGALGENEGELCQVQEETAFLWDVLEAAKGARSAADAHEKACAQLRLVQEEEGAAPVEVASCMKHSTQLASRAQLEGMNSGDCHEVAPVEKHGAALDAAAAASADQVVSAQSKVTNCGMLLMLATRRFDLLHRAGQLAKARLVNVAESKRLQTETDRLTATAANIRNSAEQRAAEQVEALARATTARARGRDLEEAGRGGEAEEAVCEVQNWDKRAAEAEVMAQELFRDANIMEEQAAAMLNLMTVHDVEAKDEQEMHVELMAAEPIMAEALSAQPLCNDSAVEAMTAAQDEINMREASVAALECVHGCRAELSRRAADVVTATAAAEAFQQSCSSAQDRARQAEKEASALRRCVAKLKAAGSHHVVAEATQKASEASTAAAALSTEARSASAAATSKQQALSDAQRHADSAQAFLKEQEAKLQLLRESMAAATCLRVSRRKVGDVAVELRAAERAKTERARLVGPADERAAAAMDRTAQCHAAAQAAEVAVESLHTRAMQVRFCPQDNISLSLSLIVASTETLRNQKLRCASGLHIMGHSHAWLIRS